MRLMLAMATLGLLASAASAQTYVHGYTKSNDTYVAPHYRSSPDNSLLNNYSTRGNVNPYTGQAGTRDPYGSSNRSSTYGTYSNPYSSTSPSQSRPSSSCVYYSPC